MQPLGGAVALVLRLPQQGHILQHDQCRGAAFPVVRQRCGRDDDRQTVVPQESVFAGSGSHPVDQGQQQLSLAQLPVGRVDEVRDPAGEDVIEVGEPRQRLRRRVDKAQHPQLVDDDETDRRLLDQLAVPGL